jgi:hypothetical protein
MLSELIQAYLERVIEKSQYYTYLLQPLFNEPHQVKEIQSDRLKRATQN